METIRVEYVIRARIVRFGSNPAFELFDRKIYDVEQSFEKLSEACEVLTDILANMNDKDQTARLMNYFGAAGGDAFIMVSDRVLQRVTIVREKEIAWVSAPQGYK